MLCAICHTVLVGGQWCDMGVGMRWKGHPTGKLSERTSPTPPHSEKLRGHFPLGKLRGSQTPGSLKIIFLIPLNIEILIMIYQERGTPKTNFVTRQWLDDIIFRQDMLSLPIIFIY